MVLPPDLIIRLTVPPALRPDSAPDCVCDENSSIESIGSTTPAIPETPPWLTAGMLCQKSLLSTPSICQFIWFGRVPFNDPKPPTEYLPYPGATATNCVKSRPFSGRSCTTSEVIVVFCVSVVVSSVTAAALTSTVVVCCCKDRRTGKV